jgi:hypothetical protein
MIKVARGSAAIETASRHRIGSVSGPTKSAPVEISKAAAGNGNPTTKYLSVYRYRYKQAEAAAITPRPTATQRQRSDDQGTRLR